MMSHMNMQTRIPIPIHTTSETSLLSKHSSLTGVLQLSKYVHLNVAERVFDLLLFSHRIEKTYKEGLWNTEERKGH